MNNEIHIAKRTIDTEISDREFKELCKYNMSPAKLNKKIIRLFIQENKNLTAQEKYQYFTQ